jgi:hypothetical protein
MQFFQIDDTAVGNLASKGFFDVMSALADCSARRQFFVTTPKRAFMLFHKVAEFLENTEVFYIS